MSKPIKTLLRKELSRRLEGVQSLVVFSLAGVDGVATNRLRSRLGAEDVHVAVVKNSVARYVLEQGGLGQASGLFEGPCALAWGGDDSVVAVVRDLLDQGKEIPSLQVKGALMDGEVFGAERIEELGNYPTREEALGAVVMLAQSAGARLASALLGPGGRIAGAVKEVEQRAEKNEAAA